MGQHGQELFVGGARVGIGPFTACMPYQKGETVGFGGGGGGKTSKECNPTKGGEYKSLGNTILSGGFIMLLCDIGKVDGHAIGNSSSLILYKTPVCALSICILSKPGGYM